MSSEILKLETEAEQLREAGKHDESIATYKKILEQDENFVRAHLALALLYDKTQDTERSVYHAEKAVEIEPDDNFNTVALSVTYQKAFEATQDPIYIQKAEEAFGRGAGH